MQIQEEQLKAQQHATRVQEELLIFKKRAQEDKWKAQEERLAFDKEVASKSFLNVIVGTFGIVLLGFAGRSWQQFKAMSVFVEIGAPEAGQDALALQDHALERSRLARLAGFVSAEDLTAAMRRGAILEKLRFKRNALGLTSIGFTLYGILNGRVVWEDVVHAIMSTKKANK